MDTKNTQKGNKSKLWNPWLFSTILLVLVLAGFVFYDKSPTFHKNINYILGIESKISEEGDKDVVDTKDLPNVKLTVLTDKSHENPPYDLEEQVDALIEELGANVDMTIIDIDDNDGKKLNEEHEFTSLPILIFDNEITKTKFYEEAGSFLTKKDDNYVLILQPFVYLKLPNVTDGQTKGVTGDAPVTIVEFSSFTCSYCAQMKDIFYQALDEYPNKIKYVYKHFDRGGTDIALANAAECAGEQDKFWEMHDFIFENVRDLDQDNLNDEFLAQAEILALDKDAYQECLEENRYNEKIENHTKEAYTFAINGTPSFFVNDIFVGGAISYETLKSTIDSF